MCIAKILESGEEMKITFVLANITIGGGTKVIFEYGHYLRLKGHNVSIIYPAMPPIVGRSFFNFYDLKYFARSLKNNLRHRNKVEWYGIETPLSKIPIMISPYIPTADIVIATEWTTAKFVAGLSNNQGIKAYFVQGYETFIGNSNMVEKTYKLPLKKIVVATWLKNIIKNISGEEPYIATNGVNFKTFYKIQENRIKSNKKRVLMLYHSNPVKGVNDGIEAFTLAQKEYKNAQLVMFGVWKGKDVPNWVEFHQNPTTDSLRDLYCSCDIFLCPSRMEGWQFPPMEAMACGLATVLTNVGGVPEYTKAGETALVSEPCDPKALSINLIKLLNEPEFAYKIANAGNKYIQKFSLQKSCQNFEKILENIYVLGGEPRKIESVQSSDSI
jgi:glycosyltransferase involved in cell wall biosynthesis